MGAYGSPDLNSMQPPADYQYSQYANYAPAYKPPKTHRLACFIGGCVVGALAFGFFSQPTKDYSASFPVSSQVVNSVVTDDSRDYLKSWAKIAVMKCLVNPSSARFLDNDADWTFTQTGEFCTVSSTVIEKNKNNSMGKGLFVVKMRYDNLNAEVTYIQIGNKVTYDITKEK